MTAIEKVTLILDSASIQGGQFRYGRIKLRPSMRIPDTTDHQLLEKVEVSASFNRTSVPQVDIYPNDLIGPQQDNGFPGWAYTVFYDQCPGNPQPWTFYVLSTDGIGPDNPQRLSDLAEAPVAQPGLQYLPLPNGGNPTAGKILAATGVGKQTAFVDPSDDTGGLALPDGGDPVVQAFPAAIGTGTETEWLNLPYYLLLPSDDTSGSTDDNNINAALALYKHVVLSPGQWYNGAPGMTHDDCWLQGSGMGTVMNVVSGGQGVTVVGASRNRLSDMQFVIGSGAHGITVAGASDFHGSNMEMTGTSAAGGIKINGDDALEQHWTDIIMRTVGGKIFEYDRTTSGYTGSLYLDRVRIVSPPSGANPFYFNSTAGSPSLNTVFMNECVADASLMDALYINNCCQCFIEGDNWFAVGSGAAAGSAPIHVAGGSYGVNILGGYLYNGLASGGFLVKVTDGSHDINIGGGITFDGTSTTTLLGLAGAGAGIYLGDYQIAFVDGIYGPVTDTPALLSQSAMQMLGDTRGPGEETQDRRWINDNITQASGLLTLSYFRAKKTEFIGHIECLAGLCTGATGATYVGFGLFTVSPAGLLTLVAKGEVTSSITLLTSDFQYIGGFNNKVTLSANYLKRKGQIYAAGALWVGSGGGPQIKASRLADGAGGLAVSGTPLDQLSAQLASQTTLGTIGSTTHAQSSLASCGYQPYFVLEA
jgi:hypothetical protein